MKNKKKVQQFLSRIARIGRRRRRIRRRRRRGRRGRRRRRNQQSLHLPEEIIAEILSILPVKSLLRLRCVSKTWRSLIGSKRFIKAHHQNSLKNPSFPHQRLITMTTKCDRLEECSLQSLLSEAPISQYSLDDAMATLLPYQISECCNGLFCVLKKSRKRAEILKEIYLWNPSTRTSKKLPEISSPGDVRNYGFGWVESSDEYKVFVSVVDRNSKVGKVYSSKTKSWKTIELSDYLRVSLGSWVFAGGKLYWRNSINLYKEEINFLDLKSEVFGRIELPFDHEFRREGYCSVGVLGGLLCVLRYIELRRNVVQVWVMKEEAWKRVATFAHLVELLQPSPLLVDHKGEILVNCGSILLAYNRQDNVFREHEVYHCVTLYVYVDVESLVSPEDL